MDGGNDVQSVSRIAPHNLRVAAPAPLRELEGWLVWRYEQVPGEKKPRKVPVYTNGARRHGKQGSPEDRANLTTFAAARDAAAKGGYDGVGLALMPEFGITALDFDHCVDPDGKMPDEVAAIANATYSEYSPSGTGVRAFVKGTFGNRKSPSSPDEFGFETFSSTGFVTFTGHILPAPELIGYQDTIADLTDRVEALCDRKFGRRSRAQSADFMDGYEHKLGLSVGDMEGLLGALDPDMGRDVWIRVGAALHHETEGDDTGLELWSEWSSGSDKFPGEERMQTEWDSFTRRAGPGLKQVTMASVIKLAKDEGYTFIKGSTVASAEDLHRAAESAREQVARLPPVKGVGTPDGFDGKFRIKTLAKIAAQPPMRWLIKRVLPMAPLSVLFGAPGSGKTFVAIDWACCVALGREWRGNKTEQGNVIYIAAEGGGGIGKRFKAYAQHHQLPVESIPVGVLDMAPNFMNKEDITDLVSSITASGGAKLIIVDTTSQVTPGANENASEDMGRALANARALHEETGAYVLLIGHSGKDATKGLRGWSGVKGAADAEFEAFRHENGSRELRNTKMKDGEDGGTWGVKLEMVTVGVDADGDDETSMVAIDTEIVRPEKESNRVERYGAFERHVLEMIETVDKGTTSMNMTKFVAMCSDALPEPEADKRDTRRQHVMRAVRALSKRKEPPIEIAQGLVVFCM